MIPISGGSVDLIEVPGLTNLVNVTGGPKSLYANAITPDGKTAWITQGGAVGTGSLVPFNISEQKFGKPIHLSLFVDFFKGVFPVSVAITPDGKLALVGTAAGKSFTHGVWIVNLETRKIEQFVLPAIRGKMGSTTPAGLAITPDGKKAYVTNPLPLVLEIDLENRLEKGRIFKGKPISGFQNPLAIAITPNSQYALVVNSPLLGNGFVTPIVLEDNSLLKSISVGKQPTAIAISPNGQYAFVLNSASRDATISQIQLSDLSVIRTIEIGGVAIPNGLSVTADSSTLIVVGQSSSRIYAVDIATGDVIDDVKLTGAPQSLAVTPN